MYCFPRVLGSITSTYMASQNYLQLQFGWIWRPPWKPGTRMVHALTFMQEKLANSQNANNKSVFIKKKQAACWRGCRDRGVLLCCWWSLSSFRHCGRQRTSDCGVPSGNHYIPSSTPTPAAQGTSQKRREDRKSQRCGVSATRPLYRTWKLEETSDWQERKNQTSSGGNA